MGNKYVIMIYLSVSSATSIIVCIYKYGVDAWVAIFKTFYPVKNIVPGFMVNLLFLEIIN